MAEEESRERRNKTWEKQWEEGFWDIIYTQPGQILSKYFSSISEGKKGLKILVPLAATTYDMIWLCDQGHSVVGTDLSESAAQRLFKQYKRTPIIKDVPSINGKLYKNESGTFKYYVGDFFKFSRDIEGQFDFIWDSKAMCSMDEKDRSKYMDVIRDVMGPKCILMFEFFKRRAESDFPHSFTKDDLKQLYGDICDVEFLAEGEFDLSVTTRGDIMDDGAVVPRTDKDWRCEEAGGEEHMVPFQTECYCMRKRE